MSGKKYDPANGEWGDHGESMVRAFIRMNGYDANKHPNGRYEDDVEYESPTEKFFVDVERRTTRTWSGESWLSYQTLHVLARRPVKHGVIFVTLSANMEKAYVSFPCDLLCVKPVPMNNCYATNEQVRDMDIMRCLPLDMTKPIEGSLARMNASRVRRFVAETENYTLATRMLRGRGDTQFGCPYGMTEDEWRELLISVEQRSGLASHLAGGFAVSPQRRFAF